ncbi:hypothetical protein BgiBS90_000854 [Biomphalaria glabrata]|nr:hypothetical protein BgiBS90_000854 [Biomphalaria glabrata]
MNCLNVLGTNAFNVLGIDAFNVLGTDAFNVLGTNAFNVLGTNDAFNVLVTDAFNVLGTNAFNGYGRGGFDRHHLFSPNVETLFHKVVIIRVALARCAALPLSVAIRPRSESVWGSTFRIYGLTQTQNCLSHQRLWRRVLGSHLAAGGNPSW